MKNRYTMVKTDLSTESTLRHDKLFEKLLCEGILLVLKDDGYLCEIDYRRARTIIEQKLGEGHK